MMRYFPSMYDDELLFSYLARLYVRSAHSAYANFAQSLLERPTEFLDPLFIATFKSSFLKELESIKPFKDIIVENTMFGYYSLFLSFDENNKALEGFLKMNTRAKLDLKLPKERLSKLKYCPLCREEKKLRLGESYIRRIHQIAGLNVCHIHRCRLRYIDVYDSKTKQITLKSLEELVSKDDASIEYVDEDSIELRVARYIDNLLKRNISHKNKISDYLDSLIIGSKYSPPRGGKRRVELLAEDFNNFYKGFYQIDKVKLSWIFRGLRTNPFEIVLLAIFLNVSPEDLSKREILMNKGDVDRKIIELYNTGYSFMDISRKLGANRSTISNVVKGVYSKESRNSRRYSPYKCPKFNWNKIEKNCINKFDKAARHYKQLGFKIMTKAMMAEYFGLGDKSLRNLKTLREKIRKYNKGE